MQSDREGDASRVANVEERTTAAHAAAPSSGDTSIGEGEGGGGRGTAPSVSTTAATSATLTVAKGDHQDQRQRDEYGHEDDVVTATWSLDSDGRPVSMPHSWHPSVHEGGGGGRQLRERWGGRRRRCRRGDDDAGRRPPAGRRSSPLAQGCARLVVPSQLPIRAIVRRRSVPTTVSRRRSRRRDANGPLAIPPWLPPPRSASAIFARRLSLSRWSQTGTFNPAAAEASRSSYPGARRILESRRCRRRQGAAAAVRGSSSFPRPAAAAAAAPRLSHRSPGGRRRRQQRRRRRRRALLSPRRATATLSCKEGRSLPSLADQIGLSPVKSIHPPPSHAPPPSGASGRDSFVLVVPITNDADAAPSSLPPAAALYERRHRRWRSRPQPPPVHPATPPRPEGLLLPQDSLPQAILPVLRGVGPLLPQPVHMRQVPEQRGGGHAGEPRRDRHRAAAGPRSQPERVRQQVSREQRRRRRGRRRRRRRRRWVFGRRGRVRRGGGRVDGGDLQAAATQAQRERRLRTTNGVRAGGVRRFRRR